jgi:multidrug efflux pump subunit AcrA (membrane-fusion protein)
VKDDEEVLVVKRRKRWIVVVVILLVVVIGASVLMNPRQAVSYAQDTATTGSIVTYFNFSGSLDVTNSLKVVSPSDTTVSEIYVTPNSVVAENARLLRLKDGTVIKAEIAGEVTSINVAVNSAVSTGDTLLEMMDLTTMKATFKVDEYDIAAVTIGKTVSVLVDGIGETFDAPISAINKRAVVSGDLSYYEATVDLTGIPLPQAALPGMQISVNVLNQQVEDVVLLSIDAVSFDSENLPFVYRQNGKAVDTVPIEVGVNDGVHVQITKGLKSGDTVLYTPTATSSMQSIMSSRSQNAFSSGVE